MRPFYNYHHVLPPPPLQLQLSERFNINTHTYSIQFGCKRKFHPKERHSVAAAAAQNHSHSSMQDIQMCAAHNIRYCDNTLTHLNTGQEQSYYIPKYEQRVCIRAHSKQLDT